MRNNINPQPLARDQWHLMTYVFARAGHAATLLDPSMCFWDVNCAAKTYNLRPQPRFYMLCLPWGTNLDFLTHACGSCRKFCFSYSGPQRKCTCESTSAERRWHRHDQTCSFTHTTMVIRTWLATDTAPQHGYTDHGISVIRPYRHRTPPCEAPSRRACALPGRQAMAPC